MTVTLVVDGVLTPPIDTLIKGLTTVMVASLNEAPFIEISADEILLSLMVVNRNVLQRIANTSASPPVAVSLTMEA